MEVKRVTLRQIAERGGVHVTTVSLALRNSSKLPPETRERIKALAQEMGYAPDPALSALVAYNNKTRVPVFQATVAWFNGYPRPDYLWTVPTLRAYLAGAQERAEELGYKLEEFWLHEPGLHPAGLRRQLLARGIRGVLVLPMGAPTALPDFAWKDFSAVAFGYSLTDPQLHRISNHQFRTAMKLFRELRRLGYRRIGLSLVETHDRRINLALSSAFGAYDWRIPEAERVALHVQRRWEDQEGFTEWLRRERPEAVVSHNVFVQDWVRAAGLAIPRDIGLAFFNIDQTEKHLSGVHQQDHRVGRIAFDTLVNMLHANERGVPDIAQHVLVDGEWMAHETTRRMGEPAPWFLDLPEEVGAMRRPLTTPPAAMPGAKPSSLKRERA
jgi:LacI family transcriptional regulator